MSIKLRPTLLSLRISVLRDILPYLYKRELCQSLLKTFFAIGMTDPKKVNMCIPRVFIIVTLRYGEVPSSPIHIFSFPYKVITPIHIFSFPYKVITPIHIFR